MSESITDQLLKQAEDDLQHATDELYRPSEDVVTYAACQFSRKALYRFLNALAIYQSENKNIILEPNLTLEQLITFCGQNNKEIDEIDFSSLHCSCYPDLNVGDKKIIYCSSVDKVHYCTDMAAKVKDITLREIGRESN